LPQIVDDVDPESVLSGSPKFLNSHSAVKRRFGEIDQPNPDFHFAWPLCGIKQIIKNRR
jgi:hypothetical protein